MKKSRIVLIVAVLFLMVPIKAQAEEMHRKGRARLIMRNFVRM